MSLLSSFPKGERLIFIGDSLAPLRVRFSAGKIQLCLYMQQRHWAIKTFPEVNLETFYSYFQLESLVLMDWKWKGTTPTSVQGARDWLSVQERPLLVIGNPLQCWGSNLD